MTTQASVPNQSDVLSSVLETNIDSFREKRDSNRRLAFRLKMIVVVIGALTTIVLGLKSYVKFENSNEILSATALVLSATVPIFATWDSFFDHGWLWIRYTETLNALYAIRDELRYSQAEGNLTGEKLDSLFSRLQRTLADADREWTQKRFKDNKPDHRGSKAK